MIDRRIFKLHKTNLNTQFFLLILCQFPIIDDYVLYKSIFGYQNYLNKKETRIFVI